MHISFPKVTEFLVLLLYMVLIEKQELKFTSENSALTVVSVEVENDGGV